MSLTSENSSTGWDSFGERLTTEPSRQAKEIKQGLFHTSAALAPALDALGWRNFFRTVQAADTAPSKPHPGMLLQALEVTSTRPENAAFIGDTTFDKEMARSAKLRPIGVAWGYH
jgi:phosphoglycolate phosphatase-like HAD superfamily hydrolase